MAGTSDRARPAQGARRRDHPGRRVGDRRAGRRARRRRAQRRGQVDAPAPAGGRRPRRRRHRPADRRHRRLSAAGARPRARRDAASTTSRAAPASPRPTPACRRRPPTLADATRPARPTATPRPSRRGWSSAAPTSSRARRPSCATSGWTRALLDLETVALSGGQAARASLAAILLSRFDVLLLDEPTNDLDFDGLARLERFVAERPGGAVIVSPRPRVPRPHGHPRARDRRDRPHRGGVRRRLGRLPRAARDRRPPRRGALPDLHARSATG